MVFSFIVVHIFPVKLIIYLKDVDCHIGFFSARGKLWINIYVLLNTVSHQPLPPSLQSELLLLRLKISFALICELHSLILLGNLN